MPFPTLLRVLVGVCVSSAVLAVDPSVTTLNMEDMMKAGKDPEAMKKMLAGGMGGGGGGGMPGMGGAGGMGAPPPKPKAAARKQDTKYIWCDVCQESVKQLFRQVTARQQAATGKKLSEGDMTEMSDKICDPEAEEGAWLKATRLKAVEDKLKLVNDWEKEKCGVDCETIARACRETFGDYSLDLAESVWRGEKRAALTTQACNDLSDVCTKKPPTLPKKHPKRKMKGTKDKKSKKKGTKSKAKKAAAPKTEL